MFSTLAGGRRCQGSISHRHKNVTVGKIAVGVAKGTAMIVIGVPVCTIAAGLGATAIVAYGLASPFYYGGRKLVKKIRRRVNQREELRQADAADRLTREDILIWLENCGEDGFDDVDPQTPLVQDAAMAGDSARHDGDDAGASASASSTAASHPLGQKRKPVLRRLFSRDGRNLLLQSANSGQYNQIVDETDDEDKPRQSYLWQEVESVAARLRQDRLSICPENVVTMDRPLLLDSSADVLAFVESLQLGGHLGHLTRAASMPAIGSAASSGEFECEQADPDVGRVEESAARVQLDEGLECLTPEQRHHHHHHHQHQHQHQRQHRACQLPCCQRGRHRKYFRTVSDNCAIAQQRCLLTGSTQT